MPIEDQDIFEKAREMIKDDVADTFSETKPPKVDETDDKDKGDKDNEDDKKDDKGSKESEESKDDKASEKDGDDKGDKDEQDDKKDDKEDSKDDVGDDDKDKDKDDKVDDKDKDDKKADDEDAALTQLADQNKALLEQIEALSGQVFATDTQDKKPEGGSTDKTEDKKDDKADDKADDGKPKIVQFVDQNTFEEATSSAEGLNALLTTVVNTAAQEGERRGYERAIRETPALVEKLTEKTVSVREAVHDFLTENPDLVPVRKFVGLMTNELRAKNPDWPVEKLFNEAGKVVREKLKLSKVAKEINDDKGSDGKPAFSTRGAGGGGKGREDTNSKLTPLQKEIGELAEHVV